MGHATAEDDARFQETVYSSGKQCDPVIVSLLKSSDLIVVEAPYADVAVFHVKDAEAVIAAIRRALDSDIALNPQTVSDNLDNYRSALEGEKEWPKGHSVQELVPLLEAASRLIRRTT